ncbi:hypothetical protein [Arenibaculum pallidiluteum]|uniref:hypothetical protein n=1 Tax=Arenibaculum pallidiluteum TaxID=2812559 RepID=UPI001A964803|nr:hypothetical protein [Arenibaculum pallidiluteum]
MRRWSGGSGTKRLARPDNEPAIREIAADAELLAWRTRLVMDRADPYTMSGAP